MNILIIDDHPLIRDGIAGVLCRMNRNIRLTRAVDCGSGLAAIATERPDLVLLDLGLPDVAGTVAIDSIRAACPDVPVVVLSGKDDRETVLEALDHGVAGFIPKNMTADQIWSALGVVIAGSVYLPAGVVDAPTLASPPPRHQSGGTGPRDLFAQIGLTDRQHDILRALVAGLSNKEIAERLSLAEPTVKAHVSAVLRAMNVGSRTQAVLWLTRRGIQLDSL
ncbi:MAG: response regulator transcription factor [Rhodocyclales bacterium]|nr:response regulator transcription factor [Rhodocyclales bacterium]